MDHNIFNTGLQHIVPEATGFVVGDHFVPRPQVRTSLEAMALAPEFLGYGFYICVCQTRGELTRMSKQALDQERAIHERP